MKPYYEHAGITIYHGDCREILPGLKADAVIADPPYGVGFSGKVTKHTDNRGADSYLDTEENFRHADSYLDTEENFRHVILPAVKLALSCSVRAAIFTGTRRLHEYPTPDDIGGIICPNGAGRSAWGFGCYHPVLFYGSSPYMAAGLGARPTAAAMYHPGMHVTGEIVDHPCPKPIAFMNWAIATASLPEQTILDPFMGGGTTLIAAKNLNRKAIGIELEEKYCEIAAKRLAQEVFDFSAGVSS